MNNDKSVEAEQIAEGRSRETGVPTVFFGTPSDRGETWIMASSFVGEGVVTFEQVAQNIYDECFDLLVQRQTRYGPTNIDQQGPWGVLSRIANDKIARIKRAFNGQVVHGEIVLDPITDTDTDESYEDALKDLVNYGVILLLLHRGLWGKPLMADVR
jgi:hypothetical protein